MKKLILILIFLFLATQISYEKPPQERRRELKKSFTIYPKDYHEKRIEYLIKNFAK